jgi:hypothetical protein
VKRPPYRPLLFLASMAIMFWTAAFAGADTFNLELKRLEDRPRWPAGSPDAIYRAVSSQYVRMEAGSARSWPERSSFSSLVKKEPPYRSKQPFRFVAVLGSNEYAFVLDSSDLDAEGYDLLCFDRNRNGDLTDDGVIKAKPWPADKGRTPTGSYVAWSRFPRVDVAIVTDGKPAEYSFFLETYARRSKAGFFADARLSAGAYRRAKLTLGGKNHTIVLLDYNSNGRFDDQWQTDDIGRSSRDRFYAPPGDVLFVDPEAEDVSAFGLDLTDCRERRPVSRLVNIDDRFYDVKVSPSGDTITLTPSSLPVASVAHPTQQYDALLFGDKGLVKLTGSKGQAVPIPVGDWKLLSYRIDLTEPEPASTTRPTTAKAERSSAANRLLARLMGTGASSREAMRRRNPTFVCAAGNIDVPIIRVREGKTSLLKFGPPYKPYVTARSTGNGQEVRLEMSLLGAGGEVCTNVNVYGERPAKPLFQILNAKGEVVARGQFEFG